MGHRFSSSRKKRRSSALPGQNVAVATGGGTPGEQAAEPLVPETPWVEKPRSLTASPTPGSSSAGPSTAVGTPREADVGLPDASGVGGGQEGQNLAQDDSDGDGKDGGDPDRTDGYPRARPQSHAAPHATSHAQPQFQPREPLHDSPRSASPGSSSSSSSEHEGEGEYRSTAEHFAHGYSTGYGGHVCDAAVARDMAGLFDKLAKRRDEEMDRLVARRVALDAKFTQLQAESDALDADWSTYARTTALLRAREVAAARAQVQDEIAVLVSVYAHDGLFGAAKGVLNPPVHADVGGVAHDGVRAAAMLKRLAELRYLLVGLEAVPLRPDTPAPQEDGLSVVEE